MLKQYKTKKINKSRLALIDTCNEIIEDFTAQGYELTLRQLYYQLVSRDLIENTESSYKRIGELVTDARMCGLMDWTAIVDRLRRIRAYSSVTSPVETLENAARRHALDLWEGQPYRVEVWVEKDALAEVVERAVSAYRVPVMVCRGYMSISAMWEAGSRRFRRHKALGIKTAVIHLGDHDPSGVDMTRDIAERLELFAECEVEVDRIALSMEQVRKHRPPPNPAKVTDSRAGEYIKKYGRKSWELDALEPKILDGLIKSAIKKRLNTKRYKAQLSLEETQENQLTEIANRYDEIVDYLE